MGLSWLNNNGLNNLIPDLYKKNPKRKRKDTTMDSGDIVGTGDYDVETKREKLKSLLSQLLADPILADVPKNPTLSDVVTLVSLEKGSAMRLSIVKLDGSSLGKYLLSYEHFVEQVVCIVDLHLRLFFIGRCGGYEFSYFEGSEAFDQEES